MVRIVGVELVECVHHGEHGSAAVACRPVVDCCGCCEPDPDAEYDAARDRELGL